MSDIDEARSRHEDFRTAREQGLAEPHGWLSVAGLTWIGDEGVMVDGFPGTWWRDGEDLHVEFSPDTGVALGGVPLGGRHTVRLRDEEADTSLALGDVVAEVIRRDGRYGVRPRDPQARLLTDFRGVPTFAYTPDAVVEAVFTAAEPRREAIGTAADGVGGSATVLGTVRFELDGAEQELAVTGSPAAPSIAFHDPTNGDETADWRFVPLEPVAGTAPGTTTDLRIDLNRSLNFPSAFIPFGTCPRPVAGNAVSIPVRAGEKHPAA